MQTEINLPKELVKLLENNKGSGDKEYVFYSKNMDSNKNLMIIGLNPGANPNYEEKKRIKESKNTEELIESYQFGLKNYFLDNKRKREFWINLFNELKIDIKEDFSNFFDKIHYTDLVKRRKIEIREEDISLLKEEIISVKPQVIISFGREVLNELRKLFDKEEKVIPDKGVTSLNGEIYSIFFNGLQIRLVILTHYSSRNYGKKSRPKLEGLGRKLGKIN